MIQEREKVITKLINRAFIVLTALIFLAGLVRTVCFPKEMIWGEKRYANKIAEPTVSGYWDGSFQKSVSDALNDQVQLSMLAKKWYNRATVELSDPLTKSLSASRNAYVGFRGGWFYGDRILYVPYNMSKVTGVLDQHTIQYNRMFHTYPELDFYVYYIEKDTDIDFITGEKIGVYDRLAAQLDLPETHIAHFAVDDLDTFEKYFYKTDHHWNYLGSYRGYTEVLSLISSDAPLAPAEEVHTPYCFSGSKAAAVGAKGVYSDPLSVYRFDYPEMSMTCDGGKELIDYGSIDMLLSGTLADPDYGAIYGWDGGELVFDTNRPDRENLLVIGDSFDNAILKLLASHFYQTYSIDLRYYKTSLGKDFNFAEYVSEHKIDKVLLIGNVDFFYASEFEIGGIA